MRRIALQCLLLILPATVLAAPPERPSAVVVPEISGPISFIQPNSILFSVGGVSGIDLRTMRGGSLSVGYQFKRMALDLRGNLSSLDYGAISVLPGQSDFQDEPIEGEPIPETELTRVRSDSDSWSYFQLEPGISVTGQFFADRFPRLSQRARFGVGLGRFTDRVNELQFLSITATFEADLEYQLFPASRWALRLGGAWQTGVLKRQDDIRDVEKRLPVSWLQASFSLLYAL